jgi:cbb3-type cytochrome oxidase subunit 3
VSLVDIVSGLGSHLWAQAALVLASLAFLTVLVTLCLDRNRDAFERARRLPLEDDSGGPAGPPRITHARGSES